MRTLKERRLTCACAFIRHALDPEDDSSSGTLRAAVSASNGNGEADTITFDLPEGNRTTTLTSGQIDFSASEQTTIDGGAAGVTVNGGASRVLQVVSGARLDLKNLTVANVQQISSRSLRRLRASLEGEEPDRSGQGQRLT